MTIQCAGTPSLSGRVADLSADGVGLHLFSLGFDRPGAPTLVVGEEVEITFASASLLKPVNASAKVMSRFDKESSRRYGFQFTDRGQLERRASPALHSLFSRRRTYRVEPAADSPVQAALENASCCRRVQTQVIDISTDGARLRVPAEAESALAATDRIRVSISLPDCQPAATLEAILRNRCLEGKEIEYGIEFDLQRTEQPQRQQDAIIEYVMQRQRAVLDQERARGH